MGARGHRRLVDEINITPLTDVFLVLLIIMMVVAPMLKMTRTEIIPPVVNGGSPIEKVRLVVEITRDGRYFVDGDETNPVNLAIAMHDKGAAFMDKDVIIQADRLTKSGAVLKVFDAAREAQFETMTVAVETLSKQRSDELEKKPTPEGTPAS
ncbi:MAG: biopolymer transporter ExbD, partial [Candidatus Hydrogenedentes bacterium]|nr:biopolymer transporter ExbD [Candidatus Hydrogenedentota bacterium]